jgi:hypothetical protein
MRNSPTGYIFCLGIYDKVRKRFRILTLGCKLSNRSFVMLKMLCTDHICYSGAKTLRITTFNITAYRRHSV